MFMNVSLVNAADKNKNKNSKLLYSSDNESYYFKEDF